MNRADGFSPGSMMLTKVSGLNSLGAARASRLPPIGDVSRSLRRRSPVVVHNARTGRRHPVWAEIDSNPEDPPTACSSFGRPGISRRRALHRGPAPCPLHRASTRQSPVGDTGWAAITHRLGRESSRACGIPPRRIGGQPGVTTSRPTRRGFIGTGVGGVAAVGLGSASWLDLLGSATRPDAGSDATYGARGPADDLGLRLPDGFRSRLVARGGEPVPGTDFVWHEASDGSATFTLAGGGWVLVSNSETLEGGASALRFCADDRVEDAYRILSGTVQNCSGGATPWGSWLSCEEVEDGLVWECDPTGRRRAAARPAMGVFKHEAAAVDPTGRRVYLSEDLVDGGFYRFTPRRWPDLGDGLLEVAVVDRKGQADWIRVPDPAARHAPTRRQVPNMTIFKRAEGLWHDRGIVYLATTADHRVHAYDVGRRRFDVIYDGLASRSAPLLRVDQLIASRGRELFVCEDIATDEIDIGVIDRRGRVSRFLSATGPQHRGSELTGLAFAPSGSRLYFASQRAFGSDGGPGPGAIYEVRGPFRGRARS
jgi:hypothetical protein